MTKYMCRRGCNKIFKTASGRAKHETGPQHNKKKAHTCECGRSYYNSDGLRLHRRLKHNAKKKYECKKCLYVSCFYVKSRCSCLRQQIHNWMVSVGFLSPWKCKKNLFALKNIQPLTVYDFFNLAYFVLPWQPIKVGNHKIYVFCNWLLQINQAVNFPFSFTFLL